MSINIIRVEYMCSRCGARVTKGKMDGKPDPGRCPRNNNKHHSWVVNRNFYRAGTEPELDYHRIEYMCRHCGARQTKGARDGKPEPGTCPRRTNGLPHAWVVQRKY